MPSEREMATVRESSSHLVCFQETEGWPGGSFNRQHTELQTRHCHPVGKDEPETQIEVQIFEWRGDSDRCFTTCSSVALSRADAERLALSIAPWLEVKK